MSYYKIKHSFFVEIFLKLYIKKLINIWQWGKSIFGKAIFMHMMVYGGIGKNFTAITECCLLLVAPVVASGFD